MRREWRFGGRSAASPSTCATADPGRIPPTVADAFVDRAPIDWTALLRRVRSSADRSLFESLRLLDQFRSPAAAGRPIAGTGFRIILVVRLMLALAALQTACGLGALGVAFVNGSAVHPTSQALLAAAFASACVLLRVISSDDRRSLFLVATFACAASAFTRAALTALPEPRPALVDLVFRGLVPEAFGPAALWQFAVDFPHVRRFTAFDRLARRAAAVAWLLGIVLFTVNLAGAYDAIDPWPAAVLRRDHPANLFWHLFVLAILPAVAAILLRSRRALPAERRQVARFAAAFAAGTAPLLVCGIARMAFPRFDQWFLMPGAHRPWLDTLIVGGLTATPIVSTAAVIVDRPFDLQAVLSTPSRARLARAALTAASIAPFIALLQTLYRLRGLSIADALSSAHVWPVVGWAALGSLFVLGRSTLLAALGAHVDHREQLASALQRVRVARGGREVAAALERELSQGIGAARVRILVQAPGGTFVDPSHRATPLDGDSVLIAMLDEMIAPLDLSDRSLRPLLPRRDAAWVRRNGVQLAAALKGRDTMIAALVLLGRRRGDRPFDRRDRWFVQTLTAAAAAVWDADGFATTSREVGFECPRCGLVAASRSLACGCGAEPALAALPHDLGGKFMVERRIGAGGMGVVYLARDTALGREVALKTLPELREGRVARLRDEARAMAALNHESLATIYGLEVWRRTPVLVVEYFPRGTLARTLAAGPLSAADAVQLGIRLVRALTYMHERGVLHRDIKPSNIAFTAIGAPKLLDFGVAMLREPRRPGLRVTFGDAVAGTFAYLPPEAYRGAPADPRFDLWGLSVVLLEAIVGRNPFAEGVRTLRTHRALPIDLSGAFAPTSGLAVLKTFFERALTVDPDLRFQTSGELEAALDAISRAPGFEKSG